MALFMDGSDPTTESERADMVGIAAIKEASALEFKEQGNKYVKMGKKHHSEAVDCYTRAINQNALSDSESSVLFANRAHVNLLLGNYHRALFDAEEAIKLCSTNIKAIYRAAKAAFQLNLLTEAASFCKKGLEQSPFNEDLDKLAGQVDSRKKECEKREVEVSNAVSLAKCLASAIANRGMKFGKAIYQELTGLQKPTLDENNFLHWPVLFLYAEVMSSDFIQDFCETDVFSDHLDMMYSGHCESLLWDKENNYTRDSIELYYQADHGISLSKGEVIRYLLEGTPAALTESINDDEKDDLSGIGFSITSSSKWIKVNEKKRLGDILQQREYIIPGLPAFYIVSNRSAFYKEFRAGKWTPP